MKKFLLFITILFAINGCTEKSTTENTTTDLQKENLNGKVKSVRFTNYEAVDEAGVVKKTILTEDNLFVYNQAGNKIEDTKFSGNKPYQKLIIKYDDNNRATEVCMYDSEGKIDFKKTITYDIKGNKLSENQSDAKGNIRVKETFQYDSKNNLIKEEAEFSDGNPNTKTIFEYDKSGNLTQKHFYTSGKIWLTEKYSKYYENGLTIQEVQNKSSELKVAKVISKYNDKGNIVEESNYDAKEEILEKIVYKYDEKGREIEANWEVSKNSSLFSKYIKTYNGKNNLSEITYVYYNGGTDKYVYHYEYDNHDNWIKQILYINGEPSVKERKIEYYE